MAEKKKNKTRINWLLVVTILLFLIPTIIFGGVIFNSAENTHKPVVAERFKNQLDPKINKNQVAQIKNMIKYPEVESVEVNLISATLRITIDVKDNLYESQVMAIVDDVYNKVNQVLPIDKYFTNRKNVKMYDLEIQCYDFLPKNAVSGGNPIYIMKTKNAAAKKPVVDNMRTPRNQSVSDRMLNTLDELKEKTDTYTPEQVQQQYTQQYTQQPVQQYGTQQTQQQTQQYGTQPVNGQ